MAKQPKQSVLSAEVVLQVSVQYDPDLATADEIEQELSTLLGTALDTPNILDAVGNPEVGPFEVVTGRMPVPPKKAASRRQK